MALEIERKFLVTNNDFKKSAKGILYRQGFLSIQKERVVRVRLAGDKGFLTIKGITKNMTRTEFEYEIPSEDAKILIDQICQKPVISKYRYKVMESGSLWEVDEFLGENEGLILAEIELNSESQKFGIPDWLGEEVTHDSRYYNANLVSSPFKNW